jgi:hypothetical protein
VLSSVFELKSYIGSQRLEELAVEMLQNPEIHASWRAALEDPAFAEDPRARFMWWYTRTPYWDERVGLLPVYRVMTPPLPTGKPWRGR